MKAVSVVGLGKVGLPMAALYAAKGGVDVVGVDNNHEHLKYLMDGGMGFLEPRLEDLMYEARTRMIYHPDVEYAVSVTDATFVIVPTPTLEATGEYDLISVLEVCRGIGRAIKQKAERHLVVIVSTVMPGDMRTRILPTLETFSGKKCGEGFGLCYSPEFIALGSVLHGLENPDLILIGEGDWDSGGELEEFYEQVTTPVYKNPGFQHPVRRMTFENAELTKLAINTFVTTKIAFANMLAAMCEKLPTGNVRDVTWAMGYDTRIGRRGLIGGTPFGGPCFPRDNRALALAAKRLGLDAAIPRTVDMVNRDEYHRLLRLVEQNAPAHGTVGVLGLSYKPGTDVTEESFGLWLAEKLSEFGYLVPVWDPLVKRDDESLWGHPIDVDVLVVTQPGLLHKVEIARADVLINCWRDTPLQTVGKRIDVGVNYAEELELA